MKSSKVSRREFLASSSIAAGLTAAGIMGSRSLGDDDLGGTNPISAATGKRSVVLVCDPEDKKAAENAPQWALAQVEKGLSSRGVAVRRVAQIKDVRADEACIVAATPSSPWLKLVLDQAKITLPNAAETLALASAGVDDRTALFACGSDARGLVYALLDVADRVAHTDPPLAALETQKPIIEQPANAIRSVARLFVSDVEDKPWFNNKTFWGDYLTMLATERFNRFNLTLGLGYDFPRQIRDCYFHFAYPFFLNVPGYRVKARPLANEER